MFDVNVLVAAIKGGDHPYRSWPSPPPTSRDAHVDCLGVINDAAEFALWLSPHIVSNVARVLSEVLGLDGKHVDDYIQVLMDLAAASAAVSPTRRRPWATARAGKTTAYSTWLPRSGRL